MLDGENTTLTPGGLELADEMIPPQFNEENETADSAKDVRNSGISHELVILNDMISSLEKAGMSLFEATGGIRIPSNKISEEKTRDVRPEDDTPRCSKLANRIKLLRLRANKVRSLIQSMVDDIDL